MWKYDIVSLKIKARKRRCANFGVQGTGNSEDHDDYEPGCTSARRAKRQSAPGALGDSKSDVKIEAACACPGCCNTEAPYRVSHLLLRCLPRDSSTQIQDNGRAVVCAEHAICVVRANIKDSMYSATSNQNSKKRDFIADTIKAANQALGPLH